MRHFVLLALLLVLLPGQAFAKKRKKTRPPDLQMNISLDKDSFAHNEPVLLTLTLANQGEKQLTLYSHVQAEEVQLDWYTVTLSYPVPSREGCNGPHVGKQKRVLHFIDDRDKSAPVKKRTVPGARVSHVVNLSEWAKRARNGGKPLLPGFYQIDASYRVSRAESPVWKGTVKSPRLRLTIAGTPPPDRCQKNPGWQYF